MPRVSMDDETRRFILRKAYNRIRQRLEARDVTVAHLRDVALDALVKARIQMELDPAWVAEELAKIRTDPFPDPEPEPK